MSVRIIKPQYSVQDIKQIYYGKDQTKMADYNNLAYRRLVLMKRVLLLLFAIIMCFCVNTNWYEDYIGWISLKCRQLLNGMLHYSLNIHDPNLQWLFGVFGALTILALYCISRLLPDILLLIGICGCVVAKKRKLVEDGELYQPPISKKDYRNFLSLYKESEEIISNMERDKKIKSVDIDHCTCTVRLHLQNNFITKEYIYRSIYPYAEKIFGSEIPNTIDFSIIDRDFNICKKGEL